MVGDESSSMYVLIGAAYLLSKANTSACIQSMEKLLNGLRVVQPNSHHVHHYFHLLISIVSSSFTRQSAINNQEHKQSRHS